MHASAEQRLQKVKQAREVAQVGKDRADGTRQKAEEVHARFDFAASSAREAMLAAEEALPDALNRVSSVLAWVDTTGRATANSVVNAGAVGLQVTQKAFQDACDAFRVVNTTQVQLQLTLDEQTFEESLRASVSPAQEKASVCVRLLLEAGQAFVRSFRKLPARNLAAKSVACAQEEVTMTFHQLSDSWETARANQEAWAEAAAACREPSRKVAVATAAADAAADRLAEVEAAVKEAAADESLRRFKLEVREKETLAAEAAKVDAEALEEHWKKRRDELRAHLGAAHLESLKSKAAAREAVERRSALKAWCSRAENLHLQLEASKFSAVEALKAETYDSKQVLAAYESRKRPRFQGSDMAAHA